MWYFKKGGGPVQVKVPLDHALANAKLLSLPRACPSDTNCRLVTSATVFITEIICPSSDFTVHLKSVGGCEDITTSSLIYLIPYVQVSFVCPMQIALHCTIPLETHADAFLLSLK